MQAPLDICKKLYDIHPQLRLAWHGKGRTSDDELNAGCFAIVQLYHRSDVGWMDDPCVTFRELWDTTVVADHFGNSERVRIRRGPIFSRHGRPDCPDWDQLARVPVYVAALDGSFTFSDGSPISTYDVFSGKVLLAVKRWLKPVEERIEASCQEKISQTRGEVNDRVDEMADYAWHLANQTSETATIKARKHSKADGDFKALDKLNAGRLELDELVAPVPKFPKKGRKQV